MSPTIRFRGPGFVGSRMGSRSTARCTSRDGEACHPLDGFANRKHSVRSSGELDRAPTRTPAVGRPRRDGPGPRADLHRPRDRDGLRPGHPRRRRPRRRLQGTERLRHRHRGPRVRPRCDQAARAPARVGGLLDRDPDPHRHRLARGCAPPGRPLPHLHGRRMLPAAHRIHRLGRDRGHGRDARAHRFARARHGRRPGHPRPVHRRLGDRCRAAKPPDGDRLEGARGGGTCRGGASGRGESARRGAAAYRPGAA